MWLGEQITERGIGNGISLIIFIGIIAQLPAALLQEAKLIQAGSRVWIVDVILLVLLAGIIAVVILMTQGTRRIPVQYAKRVVGRKVYGGTTQYIPLRVNTAGVMPIIFASSVLILPSFIGQTFAGNEFVSAVTSFLAPNTWGYVLLYLVLILGFSYFYSSLIVNPVDMSQNLKKMGSSVPGIRPGTATSGYLTKVLNRLTLLGAIFLGAVAIIPTAVERATGITTFSGIGATTLLILVGVAIETSKQIQTYVISQKYEGMVKQ